MMPSCREQYLYRQGTIISFAKDQLSEKNISIVKEHHAYCQAGTVQFKQKKTSATIGLSNVLLAILFCQEL